jgi:3-oxoacyl-[acyl-carrier protein] reductase
MTQTGSRSTALVTGASRGIGHAILLELGRSGAAAIGTATSAEGAAAIQRALDAHGMTGAGIVMDVAETASIEAALADAQQRFGEISILVNNAGITRDNLLVRMRDEEWDRVLDTDLKAAYRLCRLCLRPMMKARYGRIINVTSVVAAMGNAGQCNYAAAKAGLVGFSKSLAREVASRGITVNCVAPGFIDTDMTRALSEEQRKALMAHVPLGRFGEAAEVAACVGFLASGAAGYITGATLHINGGMLMD